MLVYIHYSTLLIKISEFGYYVIHFKFYCFRTSLKVNQLTVINCNNLHEYIFILVVPKVEQCFDAIGYLSSCCRKSIIRSFKSNFMMHQTTLLFYKSFNSLI